MRLSALEAAFLYMERPTTPMHVGSIAIFDGQPWRDSRGELDLARLRRYARDRLTGIPRLRQRPVWPAGRAGRPRWVDDPDFHISRHVRSICLAAPGTEEQLLSAAEDMLMPLLDRRYPLWELWFVEGLENGRVAVVEKIHHALVDGIGGVDLAVMLMDSEPSPARPANDGAVVAARVPSRIGLLSATAAEALREPPELALRTVGSLTHPLRAARSARSMVSAFSAVSRPLGGGDIRAPRVSINGRVGDERSYQVVRRPLGGTKELAHALGGTVNDVVLSAVAAGLGSLLAARGEGADKMRVLVPISQRGDDEHDLLGNKVTGMVVPLPVAPMEPLERFRTTHDSVRWTRSAGEGELTSTLLQFCEHVPEPFIAGISQLVHHQPIVNLVVTNVPGPSSPLYLMGSQMLEAFPIVPLAGNLTLSIGILSYLDQLTIGLWTDRRRFPDLHVLAQGIRQGFDDLEAARPPKEPSSHEPTEPATEPDHERIRRGPVGHRSGPKPAIDGDGGGAARPATTLRRPAAAGKGMHRVLPPPAPTGR